jgi:predicted solute-binding protein
MKTNIQEGIILIPDFSGFTEFVFNTKLYTEYIVRQLLSTLIDVNDQYFEISEIEGDAILFYRYDDNPSYQSISRILWKMRSAFNRKIAELSKSLSTTIDLSLKFIVHYGSFSQYNIGTSENYMEKRSWRLISC